MSLAVLVKDCKLSLIVDSGACVNLMSSDSLRALQSKLGCSFPLFQPDVQLSAVNGSDITIVGMVDIPFRLRKRAASKHARFYVTDNFPLPADGLLGLDALDMNKLIVDAHNKRIICGKHTYTVQSTPRPLLRSFVSSMTASERIGDFTGPSVNETSSSLENGVARKEQASQDTSIIVNGTQRIKAREWKYLRVRLPKVKKGADVICLSDTACVKGVLLESALHTVTDPLHVNVLVFNRNVHPKRLKDGCVIGKVHEYAHAIVPDPPGWHDTRVPIASMWSQKESSNRTALRDEMKQYLNPMDYPEATDQLLSLLTSYRDVIALPGEALGKTSVVTHQIPLQPDARPVYTAAYRLPHFQRETVKKMVDDLLEEGAIRHSSSPWSSPLFLVPKSDGSWRPVIDYRKLNQLTIPDRYPMPVLSELLQGIGKNKQVFSTLDLLSGYWQVCMEEKSSEYTAFSTPHGHFEWQRMPFGLRNAPLTFQRLMNNVFAGLLGSSVHVYLDDIIICTDDIQSHISTLQEVLLRLQGAGLKLKITKCNFFKSKIRFLGHEVDAEGIHTMDDKIKAVQKFPRPTSVENIRSFVGLSGYYRSFVRNFSGIARPLTKLLKKDTDFVWGPQQEQAFNALKAALTETPVLVFPDYSKPFTLYTDASLQGLGAVLMQPDERGKMRVIGYASRVLNDAETRYHSTEWEGLAVAWALRHFRDIIFGYPIKLYTDNEAVTKFFKGGKNLTGRRTRWYEMVMEFNPTLCHVKGKANVAADALSRNTVIAPVVSVPSLANDLVKEEQRKDSLWSKVIYCLESGDDSMLPKLPFPISQLEMQDDLLVRRLPDSKETGPLVVVIPEALVEVVLHQQHDAPQAGHPGRDKMFKAVKQKYYWSTLRRDIQSHVSKCISCARNKGHTNPPAPILEYPTVAGPFDTVSVDLLKLPVSHQGSQYLMVCVDFFSRFVIMAPLVSKSAREVAHALVTHVICPFTTPRVILSDNGLEFKNKVIEGICDMYGIKQSFITPYHPASNGLVERMNRSILEVLRHVTPPLQDSWEDWLPQVAATINGSINSSVGKTPHYIIYGCDKLLPYEVLSQPQEPVYTEDYVKVHMNVFKKVHEQVRKHLGASRAEMIQRQHKSAKPIALQVDDQVMKVVPDRSTKLDAKFGGPFVVVNTGPGNKVTVRDPTTGQEERVHVDRLKKCASDVSLPNQHVESSIDSESEISTATTQVQDHSTGLQEPSVDAQHHAYKQKLRSASRARDL